VPRPPDVGARATRRRSLRSATRSVGHRSAPHDQRADLPQGPHRLPNRGAGRDQVVHHHHGTPRPRRRGHEGPLKVGRTAPRAEPRLIPRRSVGAAVRRRPGRAPRRPAAPVPPPARDRGWCPSLAPDRRRSGGHGNEMNTSPQVGSGVRDGQGQGIAQRTSQPPGAPLLERDQAGPPGFSIRDGGPHPRTRGRSPTQTLLNPLRRDLPPGEETRGA
jgi:hypothetical protein